MKNLKRVLSIWGTVSGIAVLFAVLLFGYLFTELFGENNFN